MPDCRILHSSPYLWSVPGATGCMMDPPLPLTVGQVFFWNPQPFVLQANFIGQQDLLSKCIRHFFSNDFSMKALVHLVQLLSGWSPAQHQHELGKFRKTEEKEVGKGVSLSKWLKYNWPPDALRWGAYLYFCTVTSQCWLDNFIGIEGNASNWF